MNVSGWKSPLQPSRIVVPLIYTSVFEIAVSEILSISTGCRIRLLEIKLSYWYLKIRSTSASPLVLTLQSWTLHRILSIDLSLESGSLKSGYK